ncbi:hypothetical protein B296_00041629 [Ensete ventricosum]|uniref:K-box domain-containing protein n=1 Tax=Ensete ventricosum TaxID=4639 RepID=A0A426XSJ6_ENSVE|nr:hypothetical protein B296_00041629 [Ensete ventricosum]
MLGEGTAGHMTLDELLVLEKHLEMWMCHIRATKMQIMFQEIQSLKNKVPTFPSPSNSTLSSP